MGVDTRTKVERPSAFLVAIALVGVPMDVFLIGGAGDSWASVFFLACLLCCVYLIVQWVEWLVKGST